MQRRVIIIAGANGAGKTTFAKAFLPSYAGIQYFVNADLIAAGLSPFDPDSAAMAAGRLMISQIREHILRHHDFSLETTLSGRRYVRLIPEWQKRGYSVKLIYLKLRSIRLALARVSARVKQGGHAIKPEIVRRRYKKGWYNFQHIYRDLVDSWELYENSGDSPQLIEMASK
jgi:predicted ABC-type ATPase